MIMLGKSLCTHIYTHTCVAGLNSIHVCTYTHIYIYLSVFSINHNHIKYAEHKMFSNFISITTVLYICDPTTHPISRHYDK